MKVRDLIPPDPNAPVGPPPSFEASLLDRIRQEALAPPKDPDADEVVTIEGNATEVEDHAHAVGNTDTPDGEDAGPEVPGKSREPYSVPPAADQRAETEVAALRQIETGPEPATLDVTR